MYLYSIILYIFLYMYMIFSYFVFGYKNRPSMSLHPTPTPTPHVAKGIKSADSFWCLSKTRHQIPKTIQKHSFCKGGRFDDWSDWFASNPNTFWTNPTPPCELEGGSRKSEVKPFPLASWWPRALRWCMPSAAQAEVPNVPKGEDGLPGLGRSAKPFISHWYRPFAFGKGMTLT